LCKGCANIDKAHLDDIKLMLIVKRILSTHFLLLFNKSHKSNPFMFHYWIFITFLPSI